MPITDHEHWQKVLDELKETAEAAGRKPSEVKVIAVTKGFDNQLIKEAWKFGFRHFGENRVGEALDKKHELRKKLPGIKWHMIGHVQSKKARRITGEFELIHSMDRHSIVKKLAKRLQIMGNKQHILLQVNVSGEESKYGATPEEAPRLVEEILEYDPYILDGLMTMAPWTDDEKVLRETFSTCRRLRDRLAEDFAIDLPELSMGMTNDYKQAIQEGATMLRLGRLLFGERKG
ncbi:MAG: YggS family pyridoxal phosphate-dependent enzyme [bacterium]